MSLRQKLVAPSQYGFQFQRIARDSGIDNWGQYINVKANPYWRQIGLDCIERGIDPDK